MRHWDCYLWHNVGDGSILFYKSVALGHLQLITKPPPLDVILWTVAISGADLGSFCALCTLLAF